MSNATHPPDRPTMIVEQATLPKRRVWVGSPGCSLGVLSSGLRLTAEPLDRSTPPITIPPPSPSQPLSA